MPPRFPADLQAVTFDVGGTLITPDPSVGEIYARVAARHGHPGLAPDTLGTRFRAAWRDASNFQHRRADWESLVDSVFRGLVPRPPSATFFPALYDEFARTSVWRLYPDVIPTLENLAAHGLDLGIVSNWDERLRPLLRGLRLERYFHAIVISCESGFPKPSPVIFESALRQLGRPASRVLHVGDSLREDFAGATAAGLSALHLDRATPGHDLQIQSLEELGRWLAI